MGKYVKMLMETTVC